MTHITHSTTGLARYLAAINLSGPIFTRELRITSRRFRTYLLRSIYVALLAAAVGFSWLSITGGHFGNSLAQKAMASQVGAKLFAAIGGFQFVVLHLIAPVLTGTAISDEIKKQTLPALMMTPLTGLQIIVGKLLSQMLTIVMLIATTLPLLAIIRIFGGVEWRLLVDVEALTVTAAMFAAAMSLMFSTFLNRKRDRAAGMTLLCLLLLYAGIPALILALYDGAGVGPEVFAYFNPFTSLGQVIGQVTSPATAAFIGWSAPWLQCLLLLGATALIVVLSAAMLRRVALRTAAGQTLVQLPGRRQPAAPKKLKKAKPHRSRRVWNHPVLWRELDTAISRKRWRRWLTVGLTTAILIAAYGTAAYLELLEEETFHAAFVVILFLIAIARAATSSPTTIVREKEASTWESLLLTALSPREILFDKANAVLITRVAPILAVMIAHVVVFSALGRIHPLGILYTLLIPAGPIIFLVGTGTRISLRAKNTRSAVISNQLLAVMLWLIGPFLFQFVFFFLFMIGSSLLAELAAGVLAVTNPFSLLIMAFQGVLGEYGRTPTLSQMDFGFNMGPLGFSAVAALASFAYAFVGYLFVRSGVKKFYRYSRAR